VDRGQEADRPGCDRLTSNVSVETSVNVGQRRSSVVNVGRPADGLIFNRKPHLAVEELHIRREVSDPDVVERGDIRIQAGWPAAS
jgi:hypothetical protein